MARIPHCCGCFDRPAFEAPILPLPWEPPYSVGVGLKKTEKKKIPANFSKYGTKITENGYIQKFIIEELKISDEK